MTYDKHVAVLLDEVHTCHHLKVAAQNVSQRLVSVSASIYTYIIKSNMAAESLLLAKLISVESVHPFVGFRLKTLK